MDQHPGIQAITLVGMGRMGRAIASRLLASGVTQKQRLHGLCRSQATADELTRTLGLRCTTSVDDSLERADVVLLCVKPKDLFDTLAYMRPTLASRARRPLIISIAAGVSLASIGKRLPVNTPLIRAMPSTACSIGRGATAFAAATSASAADRGLARTIFSHLGHVEELPESSLDAVTALSASGLAFCYRLFEAMETGAVDRGLETGTARRLTIETWIAAAEMIRTTQQTPDELAAQVVTAGGTTAAGLAVLEAHHVGEHVTGAVHAAADRAAELSKQFT